MRLTAAAVALGLLTAGCHLRLAPVTGAPSVAESNDPFLVVAEADRLATPDLWPGFELRAIPVAIYDGERTLLFRHPAAPDGFEQLPDRPDVWVLHGRHPRVTSNSSAEIGGVLTATLMPAAADVSLRARAGTLIHEAFHVFQRQRHPGWLANEVELFTYPVGDIRLLSIRRRETEALRRALSAADTATAACWAHGAMERRRSRSPPLGRGLLGYERATELNEGLATYIEQRATGVPDDKILPAEDFAPDAVRHRAYRVGAAIARLLDHFAPAWKTTLAENDSLPLDVMLSRAFAGRTPDPRCALADAAEAQRFAAAAAADIDAMHARRAEQRRAFVEQPGWTLVVIAGTIPLFAERFDPLNVHILGPGEVLHTRFVALGNADAEVEILGRASHTAATGPHPLFSGVREVTIAGLASEPALAVVGDTVRINGEGVTAVLRGTAVDRAGQTITLRISDWMPGQRSDRPLFTPWRVIAEQVHGFGGAFIDENGVLNVYLMDLPAPARVEEIVRRELVRRGRPDMSVRFLQGRYSYRELASIGHALLPYLGPPGIAYYGINERANRSLIGVVTEEARVRLEAAIAELGLPRDAVILEPADYFHVTPAITR